MGWYLCAVWFALVTSCCPSTIVNNCGNDEEAENENKSVYPASFQRRWGVVQDFSLFVKDRESKHLPKLGHQYCVNLFCLSWKSFCGFCNNKSSFGGAVVTYNDEEAFCILLYSGHFSGSQAQTSISSPILSQRDTPPVPGRRKTQKRRNKT